MPPMLSPPRWVRHRIVEKVSLVGLVVLWSCLAPSPASAATPGTNGLIAFQTSDNALWVIPSSGGSPRKVTGCFGGTDLDPAWSPDGNHLVFSSSRTGAGGDLFVLNGDGQPQVRLTSDPAAERYPAWSPDGRRIAYVHSGAIWLMDANGANQHPLAPNVFGSRPAWSPDGSKLAFVGDKFGQGIYTINVNGTDERRILVPSPDRGSLDAPDWSPDGTRLTLIEYGPNLSYEWKVADADGSNVSTLVARRDRGLYDPMWSPDGTHIVLSADGLYIGSPTDGSGTTLLSSNAGDPAWQSVTAATTRTFNNTAGCIPSEGAPADSDGDGRSDAADSCPTQPATTPNGCPPPPPVTQPPEPPSSEPATAPSPPPAPAITVPQGGAPAFYRGDVRGGDARETVIDADETNLPDYWMVGLPAGYRVQVRNSAGVEVLNELTNKEVTYKWSCEDGGPYDVTITPIGLLSASQIFSGPEGQPVTYHQGFVIPKNPCGARFKAKIYRGADPTNLGTLDRVYFSLADHWNDLDHRHRPAEPYRVCTSGSRMRTKCFRTSRPRVSRHFPRTQTIRATWTTASGAVLKAKEEYAPLHVISRESIPPGTSDRRPPRLTPRPQRRRGCSIGIPAIVGLSRTCLYYGRNCSSRYEGAYRSYGYTCVDHGREWSLENT